MLASTQRLILPGSEYTITETRRINHFECGIKRYFAPRFMCARLVAPSASQ